MKFYIESNFLTKGSTQPPPPPDGGSFVAMAIASSSEVDLINAGGHVLAPMTLGPYVPNVLAVRQPYANALETVLAAADNVLHPGEKLVLQLYEPGDPLVAPGPRSPYITGGAINNAPTTANTAQLLSRIPFSGRAQCTVMIAANAITDTFVVFRGVRYANVGITGVQLYAEETTADDAWAGAGAMPTSQVLASGLGMSRSWNLGGAGDAMLGAYDEIQVYAWNSVAGNAIVWAAECFGERCQP
jgi:hypothetical protein